jgi:hypothetical protein
LIWLWLENLDILLLKSLSLSSPFLTRLALLWIFFKKQKQKFLSPALQTYILWENCACNKVLILGSYFYIIFTYLFFLIGVRWHD